MNLALRNVIANFPITVVKDKIDELWHEFDIDKNGKLDRQEARLFI